MSKNCNCNCNCDGDYLPPCPPCGDVPLPPPRPLPPCPPTHNGCSNQTPNYGLPLWKASDVTSWLMQMNGAMLRIDTIMHDLALRTGINGLPDDLVTTVSKLTQDFAQLSCTVAELGNKTANTELLMQNINTQVSALKTDMSGVTITLTNLDTRLMTVDTKVDGQENKVALLRTDMNMLNQAVTALQSSVLEFQNNVNQSLAELTTNVNAGLTIRPVSITTIHTSHDNSIVDITETANSENMFTVFICERRGKFERLVIGFSPLNKNVTGVNKVTPNGRDAFTYKVTLGEKITGKSLIANSATIAAIIFNANTTYNSTAYLPAICSIDNSGATTVVNFNIYLNYINLITGSAFPTNGQVAFIGFARQEFILEQSNTYTSEDTAWIFKQ